MVAENILVVDDEPIIGIGFKRELGDMGYNVDSVLSGGEALKVIKLKKYDVVFIDKIMPDMDGIETCKELKKISPDSICIFMTGHFDKESVLKEAKFIEAGGKSYYLYKPFVPGEVLEIVQKALSEKGV